VVDIASSDFIKITNSEAWIKISSGGVTFAQEKLMAVPYALHAQNGAPTGSIMPYVGSTAPAGWLLCDGSSIPTTVEYDGLRKLLGSGSISGSTLANNVPDLRGMFVRGAGTNGVSGFTTYAGPSLGARQAEMVGTHAHTQQGTITTTSNGLHEHDYYTWVNGSVVRGTGANQVDPARGAIKADPENPASGSNDYALKTNPTGDHTHSVTLSGNTANNSGTETRPVNFGVNYIIKI
jgi:microcystin-dependent protein